MKRLNEEQLTNRIHTFLDRKMQEFPELRPSVEEQSIRAVREAHDIFRTTNRFGFHWHNTPHAA